MLLRFARWKIRFFMTSSLPTAGCRRWQRFAGASLIAAVIGGWALMMPAAAAPAPRQADVVAFCQAHPTVDFPGPLFFGSGYKPGALPRPIAKLDDGLLWRCMDGRVLVCSDSADGDWCSRKDASRTPSPQLRQACREEPDKDSFSFAEEHYSAFDWRCKKGVPVILQSYALDGRGFFKTPWAPVIIRRGAIVGPTDFPPGPR
jgi:hypothetical protein